MCLPFLPFVLPFPLPSLPFLLRFSHRFHPFLSPSPPLHTLFLFFISSCFFSLVSLCFFSFFSPFPIPLFSPCFPHFFSFSLFLHVFIFPFFSKFLLFFSLFLFFSRFFPFSHVFPFLPILYKNVVKHGKRNTCKSNEVTLDEEKGEITLNLFGRERTTN